MRLGRRLLDPLRAAIALPQWAKVSLDLSIICGSFYLSELKGLFPPPSCFNAKVKSAIGMGRQT
jgi:hypothetical protein